MLAPWAMYPEIRAGGIGWRMGRGEDYRNKFYDWFGQMNDAERASYIRTNPEPDNWDGFYEVAFSR